MRASADTFVEILPNRAVLRKPTFKGHLPLALRLSYVPWSFTAHSRSSALYSVPLHSAILCHKLSRLDRKTATVMCLEIYLLRVARFQLTVILNSQAFNLAFAGPKPSSVNIASHKYLAALLPPRCTFMLPTLQPLALSFAYPIELPTSIMDCPSG